MVCLLVPSHGSQSVFLVTSARCFFFFFFFSNRDCYKNTQSSAPNTRQKKFLEPQVKTGFSQIELVLGSKGTWSTAEFGMVVCVKCHPHECQGPRFPIRTLHCNGMINDIHHLSVVFMLWLIGVRMCCLNRPADTADKTTFKSTTVITF